MNWLHGAAGDMETFNLQWPCATHILSSVLESKMKYGKDPYTSVISRQSRESWAVCTSGLSGYRVFYWTLIVPESV